jgi:hypothetical protein
VAVELIAAVASALVAPALLILGFLAVMALIIVGLARSDQYA